MTDREKVIKEYEDYVNSYISLTTSHDYELEMHKAVLDLLKEQENKKLIDADKLREKLGFAECCEDCKRDSWKCGRETIYSFYDFCAAIDIAIEELTQEGR